MVFLSHFKKDVQTDGLVASALHLCAKQLHGCQFSGIHLVLPCQVNAGSRDGGSTDARCPNVRDLRGTFGSADCYLLKKHSRGTRFKWTLTTLRIILSIQFSWTQSLVDKKQAVIASPVTWCHALHTALVEENLEDLTKLRDHIQKSRNMVILGCC